MDATYLSGLAAIFGSAVGALASFVSAWLIKRHEARARQALENKHERQKLYAEFMDEASKLYVDALTREQVEAPAMVKVYALISDMRMASQSRVVKSAEAVVQTILATYSRPNKTVTDLQDLMVKREFVDPLLAFSEVCRDELNEPASL